MKIDFCSDLHVDAWVGRTILHDPQRKMWLGKPFESTFVDIDWEVIKNPESQVLVIAGDISNSLSGTLAVIECASLAYQHVVVIDGNHDHYEGDLWVEKGMDFLQSEISSKFPNVHYLNGRNQLVLDGVAFVGVTGWYDWKAYETQGISEIIARVAWKQYSNDSQYPKFACGSPEVLAKQQAADLASQVKALNSDPEIHTIVMTTHMSPRADLMEWKNNDVIWNALTPSYVNTALDLVLNENTEGKISHWFYGHTHERKMKMIDGILYANNARGYPRENPPFSLHQVEVGVK